MESILRIPPNKLPIPVMATMTEVPVFTRRDGFRVAVCTVGEERMVTAQCFEGMYIFGYIPVQLYFVSQIF